MDSKEAEIHNEIFAHKNIKINKIISPPHFRSEEFCQSEDEWVTLLQGESLLRIGEEDVFLKSGDAIFIPKNTPHTILETSKNPLCIWLAVHIFEDTI